jgi:hypothetical protein
MQEVYTEVGQILPAVLAEDEMRPATGWRPGASS